MATNKQTFNWDDPLLLELQLTEKKGRRDGRSFLTGRNPTRVAIPLAPLAREDRRALLGSVADHIRRALLPVRARGHLRAIRAGQPVYAPDDVAGRARFEEGRCAPRRRSGGRWWCWRF